jgi:hypothetical protein
MAAYNPHWYVAEREEAGPLFDRFVAFVRSGPIRRCRGGRYHCVTVDEWDYWLTHAGGRSAFGVTSLGNKSSWRVDLADGAQCRAALAQSAL